MAVGGVGGSFQQESIFYGFPQPGGRGNVYVQIDGTDVIRTLGPRYRAVALPLLLKAVGKGLETTLRVIKPLTPMDLGEARNSWKPRFTGVTISHVEGEIYSELEHMPALEFGRQPGSWPPSNKLEQWGRRKFGVAGLGYILAKKVYERGLPGHFMAQTTYDIIQPAVEQDISDAIDAAIRSL